MNLDNTSSFVSTGFGLTSSLISTAASKGTGDRARIERKGGHPLQTDNSGILIEN